MGIDVLCALSVETLTAKDCLMFLWAALLMLPETLRLIQAWGFTFRTVAFIQLRRSKKNPTWFYGLGHWARGNMEIYLFAKRGYPRRYSRSVHQFIISPIEEHSKKPGITREETIGLAGGLSCAELFARQRTPGRDIWGSEMDSDFPPSAPKTR